MVAVPHTVQVMQWVINNNTYVMEAVLTAFSKPCTGILIHK